MLRRTSKQVIDWQAVADQLAGSEQARRDPVEWAEAVSGHTLDDWQAELLRSQDRRLLLLCSRQVGKSEAVALLAAYSAVTAPLRVLCLAPTQRQASLLYLRVAGFLRGDPDITFSRSTRTELALSNGSMIWALPGALPDQIRGFVADIVIIDEACFARDTLLTILLPMLATTQGRLILLSTPSGPSGSFHKAWTAEEGWTKISVHARDCPRISEEFLAEIKQRLGSIGYRQEVDCEFLAGAQSFFSPDILAQAFADVELPELVQRAFQ